MGWLPITLFYFKGYKMKKGIHPNYVDCKVTCACGNEFTIKSDKETMSIDICNECHPFFTGSEKIVDAAGRVEKFKNKYKLS
jgi:large subunit ribosomal protein L31